MRPLPNGLVPILTCCALLSGSLYGQAQDMSVRGHRTSISTNPFALVWGTFGAEIERTVSNTSTVGIGGAAYSEGRSVVPVLTQPRIHAEALWRYYPEGTPLEGWSVGVKAGFAQISSTHLATTTQKVIPTYGFDVNRSWIIGAKDELFVSTGFGIKRYVKTIPTFRIVNIGLLF